MTFVILMFNANDKLHNYNNQTPLNIAEKTNLSEISRLFKN